MNKEQCLAKLDEISNTMYWDDYYYSFYVDKNLIDKAKEILELLNHSNVNFITLWRLGVQIEFKQDIKEAELAIENSSYELLLCPTNEYASWIEFDNLTKEEVVSKVTEFFNNEHK